MERELRIFETRISGANDVYNIFHVAANDWLVTDEKRKKAEKGAVLPDAPALVVDAPGFVLINVEDSIVIDEMGCVTESRGIAMKQKGKKKDYCKFPKWPRKDRKNNIMNDVVRDVSFAPRALGADYLLHNLHSVLDDGSNGWYIADQLEQISSAEWDLHPADIKDFQPSSFKGTIIVGNIYSEMETDDLQWDGGQLFAQHVKMDYDTLYCGLFVGNTFCGANDDAVFAPDVENFSNVTVGAITDEENEV